MNEKQNSIALESSGVVDLNYLDYSALELAFGASKVGLRKRKAEFHSDRDRCLQIYPEHFHFYRRSKIETRTRGLENYYRSLGYGRIHIEFLISLLAKEYPQFFTINEQSQIVNLRCELTKEILCFNRSDLSLDLKNSSVSCRYLDSFDALTMQLPGDLVLHQVESDGDRAHTIHLCHANGWSAPWGVGKSFSELHLRFPIVKKILPMPKKILESFTKKDAKFERLGAVQFRTSKAFDRHPDISREILNPPLCPRGENLYLRFERQSFNPVPGSNFFLFYIHTYFTPGKYLVENPEQRKIVYEFLNQAGELPRSTKTLEFCAENREALLKIFSEKN